MPNPPMPIVKFGSKGVAVYWAQRGVRRGLPDPSLVVDGIFGTQTEAAVKFFQEGANLAPDGCVGPETWAALPYGAPMPELWEGDSGAVVKSLQKVLATEWAPHLKVDGDFGSETTGAVQAFQRYAGLTTDGIVGEHTWDASVGGMMQTLETRVGLEYVVPPEGQD
jgi:peptidoglycan hydrolase-like protein with peptidoglycan-binding domain